MHVWSIYEHPHKFEHSPEQLIPAQQTTHSHGHSHGGGHGHSHGHSQAHSSEERNLNTIELMIQDSLLPAMVKQQAIAVRDKGSLESSEGGLGVS